ncbi:PAS domain S-box protein [Leptospira fluminis]|uniref:histidine kinase n=1 Tax=Leptospira fluminis TaxID=2484979 RepID=A0A4R9GQ83_9LEPT|nr:PAS domain S-box protein [Leptospira fluminis]TGK18730.1 PAS domain S-box protein [Leptospira fluminis]
MNQETIKHSELTFQAMVESTPNAILLVNKEGKVVYLNNQSEKLFGYTRFELIGRLVEELIPKRFRTNHPKYREGFFSSPTVRAMGSGRDLFALRKDGSTFPVEIGLNPVVTADGTLVLASIIDISERKKAEERFRLVVESAPNAMILVNQNGIITLANNQTEKLFRYDRAELIGNKLEILLPERFRENHPQHRNSFFQNPTARSMGAGRDLYALRKDGTEVQVEIGLNPIDTIDGLMVIASVIDITERKTQEKIVLRQKELEVKNKELEQFAYLASHDLQEPLRTVSNYIQVIEEDFGEELNEEVRNSLNTIKSATNRMSVLVRALLDFSRLGRGKTLSYADCNKVVSDVISDLESLIKSSGTKLTVGKLPRLNSYETELRQLFQNMISNAIKFKKEGIRPEIRIESEKLGEQWKFSIQDNGIGIDPMFHERIFQIFQRLHPEGQYEGYGIGLANCKKIVELHGGRIWLDSEKNSGCTFHFTLSDLPI